MLSLHFLLKYAICISCSKLVSKLNIALQSWLHFFCGLKAISDYKYKTYAMGKRDPDYSTGEKYRVRLQGTGKGLKKNL